MHVTRPFVATPSSSVSRARSSGDASKRASVSGGSVGNTVVSGLNGLSKLNTTPVSSALKRAMAAARGSTFLVSA
eukprot:5690005-Prymnesium_polylepis.1